MRIALRDWIGRNSGGASHAGLTLRRLLDSHENRDTAYRAHVDQTVRVGIPEPYEPALDRWRDVLATLGAATLEVTTRAPLAVGLGNASPIEVGLTLHQTWGVPYLPGSALKGLARRAARHTGVPEADQRVIFGPDLSPDQADPAAEVVACAGYATFWDGWLIPPAKGSRVLKPDVITVHHPAYYRTHGAEPPTDFDDPTPIPFVSVRPGVRFLVAVSCPESAEVADLALSLTLWGLRVLGIGGKTNAGYGRLD